jgi:uncharacterized protein (DUF1786 family)
MRGGGAVSENKRDFVRELGELIRRYSREDIAALTYHKDDDGFEAVTIRFGNGYEKSLNVTGDSVIAIMVDVYKAL